MKVSGAAEILAIDKARIERRLEENDGFAGRFYKALAVFLADRLRSTTARGKTGSDPSTGVVEADELDETVLDGISMTGIHFRQMLETPGHSGTTS